MDAGLISAVIGIAGLLFALILFFWIKSKPTGTDLMKEISETIHDGAMVFLKREYSILVIFVIVIFALLSWKIELNTGLAFLGGAFCSMLAGYFGMNAATSANVRTTAAAKDSGQSMALSIAFSGGAVMGMAVASLGLIGVGIVYYFFGSDPSTASTINGFAMGASSIALFARIGGGIFTKAADVGADLVGKVEAGIPEDDPRNPAVIADNVGDNVGDTAGMGADLFESYVGSVIATMAIAATISSGALSDLIMVNRAGYMQLPLMIVAFGALASMLGVLSVRLFSAMNPAAALRLVTYVGAAVMLVAAYFIIDWLKVDQKVFWAILGGNVAGIILGLLTEYYTAA
ncbi:MAG: sodium/proton-translocating pyrophosphatase, partial [candidate division Zixibacteria bacterium]|nr:sodium/proton-translocating pyrophosphatase [candidate division Zixibacteria bacterium]